MRPRAPQRPHPQGRIRQQRRHAWRRGAAHHPVDAPQTVQRTSPHPQRRGFRPRRLVRGRAVDGAERAEDTTGMFPQTLSNRHKHRGAQEFHTHVSAGSCGRTRGRLRGVMRAPSRRRISPPWPLSSACRRRAAVAGTAGRCPAAAPPPPIRRWSARGEGRGPRCARTARLPLAVDQHLEGSLGVLVGAGRAAGC